MLTAKTILKGVLYFVLFLILLYFAWAAYINFHGDEKPDAGRDAFYAQTEIVIPDIDNLAVAMSGINASEGADMIKHGRFVINQFENEIKDGMAKALVQAAGKLEFVGTRDDFDCWIDDTIEKTTSNCASTERIKSLIVANKTLIARYKDIQTMQHWQGQTYGGGQTFIDLNQLLAAEIKVDIAEGKTELAYQKWYANYLFVNRLLNTQTNMIGRAIFLVMQGLSLNSLDAMLHQSPELITVHQDELLHLLPPKGLNEQSLISMLKAEYHFSENAFIKIQSADPKFHANYIRNRIYHVHQDILKEARKTPFLFEDSKNRLHEKYHYGPGDSIHLNWLNPLNSLLSKMATRHAFSGFNLVGSMHTKSTQVKLLNLSIQIRAQSIADKDIRAFLIRAGRNYYNPFTNKPASWDAVKRVLYVNDLEDKKRRVEVKL